MRSTVKKGEFCRPLVAGWTITMFHPRPQGPRGLPGDVGPRGVQGGPVSFTAPLSTFILRGDGRKVAGDSVFRVT